jgi:hypothetical protein
MKYNAVRYPSRAETIRSLRASNSANYYYYVSPDYVSKLMKDLEDASAMRAQLADQADAVAGPEDTAQSQAIDALSNKIDQLANLLTQILQHQTNAANELDPGAQE